MPTLFRPPPSRTAYPPYQRRAWVPSVAVAGTTYTLTAPGTTTGPAGVASGNFTLTPNGAVTATITPSDGGAGGTFTPSSRSWSAASNAQTFTYTPPSSGPTAGVGVVRTISTTNNAGLTDPGSVTYTAVALANVAFMGDSKTAGFLASDNWPNALFGLGPYVYGGSGTVRSGPILATADGFYFGGNYAASGLRIDQFEASGGAGITAAYNPAAPANYLVVEGGANDIHAGADENTCLTRMKAFVAGHKSEGYKAVLLTMLPADFSPASGPTYNAVRNALNALYYADHSWYDGLVDIARDARFGADGKEFNPDAVNWFSADHVHWPFETLGSTVGVYVAAKLYDLQNGDRTVSGGTGGVSLARFAGGPL